MNLFFYGMLWCAVQGTDVINCSEDIGICDVYKPDAECMRCAELEDQTYCGADINTYE